MQYISTKKAAEMLNVTPNHVRDLVGRGILTTDPEWDGHGHRVSVESVEAYRDDTEARKRGPKAKD